jgi:DNA-binding IclR family transcriptional regulator
VSSSSSQEDATITAVLRAADVLTALAQSSERRLGVTDLARSLGLSKAVVYRLLTSLRVKGLVEYDEETRRYQLGHQSLLIGSAYLEKLDFRDMAHGVLVNLSEATDETATLSVRTGWERVYVDQVAPDRDIRMVVPIGRPFPLHAGSSSKALLAFLSDAEQERYLSDPGRLTAVTATTVTDVDGLRRELKTIRECGYATSRGERQAGAASIAAPLLGREGEPVAVISLCGPVERFGDRLTDVADLLLTSVRVAEKRLRL